MTRLGLALSVALLLAAPGATVAGESAPEATAVAREHFHAGTRLYDLGRYHDAAKEYEAAFAAKDDPALLFNIGQAYRLAGEASAAIGAYRGYLRRVPDAPNRAEVEARIKDLQQKAAAAAAPAPTPTPAPTPAAAAPLAEPPAAPLAATSSDEPGRRPLRLPGAILGGIGVLGLISGAVLLGTTAIADAEYLHPTDGVYHPGSEDRRAALQTAAIVTLVAGGVLLAGGVALFAIGSRSAPRDQARLRALRLALAGGLEF